MKKKRNWAFVGYPESLPIDWLEIIQQKGIPFAVSPLHEFDFNPDGEVKKPHYHVILCFDGPTTFENVKSLTDSLNAPIPIPIESVKGYYRYLTHKDNPEKYQYKEEDIKTYNGFDVTDYLTNSEMHLILREIIHVIRDHNFVEYQDLIDYLEENNFDYFKIACNKTIFLNTYLTSKRHNVIM